MAQALHPIVARRERLLLYLTVWLAFGALLAGVVAYRGDTTFGWASVFTMPLCDPARAAIAVVLVPRAGAADGRHPARRASPEPGSAPGFVMLAIWVAAALGWAWLLRGHGAAGAG